MSRNTTNEELASLAETLKGSVQQETQEPDSSLTSEKEDKTSTETTQVNSEKNSIPAEVPKTEGLSEGANKGLDKKDAQEDAISKEEYEQIKKELEELKAKSSEKPQLDLKWFESEEGRLWARDLDNVDPAESAYDLLVEKYMKEEGYSKSEAEDEIEYKYKLLFEDGSEEENSTEYQAQKRRFDREAKTYLAGLRERKSKIEVPVAQAESTKGKQIAEEDLQKYYQQTSDTAYKQRAEQRAKIADSLLKGREKSTLKFGDIEIEYEMTKEVADGIRKDLTHLERIGQSYVKGEEILENDLFALLAFKNDPQTILKAYAGPESAKAKEKLIKEELKNTNFSKTSTKGTSDIEIPDDHPLAEATRALMSGGAKRR